MREASSAAPTNAAVPLVDEDNAAAFLGVSPRTMQRWRLEGCGPSYLRLGRLCRYDRADLEEYVRACRERGILRLRLAHGRGRGVQRAAVVRTLGSLPGVLSFEDAPPESGGWGATVVVLVGDPTSSVL